MIEQKINDKVEDTIVAALETKALKTNEAIDPVVDQMQAEDATTEATYQPDALEPEDDVIANPEPVQVAGLGSVIKSGLEAVKDRALEAEKRVTMDAAPPPPIQQVGRTIVVAPADPDELKLINEQLGGEYVKGLNFPAIFEAGGEFDAAAYLAKFKDANQGLFEKARRGTITFEQMMVMAQERGLDQVVFDLAKRQPGDVLPPEDFLAGMLAYSQLIKQSRSAFSEAFQMPTGPEREAAMMAALQMATVSGRVAENLSGTVSEAARTVQLAGELQRRGVPSVIEELTLFGAKTSQDIEYVGRHYLAITDPSAQARFIKKAANAKSMDVITEVWINAILTSPVTHMVNIAGNATYMAMNVMETFVASGFGKLRSTITGNKDRVRAREGLAQLEGMRAALGDAFMMAGKTALTETPSDLASKIDVRTRRAIGTTGDPRKMFDDGAISGAVNAFGIYARLGGRALLAEDEFFKAIGGRVTLYQIASMRASDMYEMTIKTGGSVEDAKKAYALERANVINNPSEDVKRSVVEAARDMTFQGDLDGFLAQMQGALNHPIAKLFVPFFKTPVNVMKATLERSPAMLVYPGFYKKVTAGGREADVALAKAAMGSAIFGSFAYAAFGLDGEDQSIRIFGAGPSDKEARAAMLRQGFQPYSINIRQEDGSYKSITYSRFDPISGVLAMAADFAYYAQYETNQETLDEMAMAMSVGLAEYLIEMPLLQGLSEIQSAMQRPSGAEKFDALFGLLGEKMTEAALTLAPTVSSFTAGVTRQIDTQAKNTMLPSEGFLGEDVTTLPAFARGFYSALQKAKARNPFFNKDLPPKLNEWGEELTVGTGVWWEFWSPVRIKDAKFSVVDKEMMDLGDGISRTPQKIDGVLLNADQYNQWIRTTNLIDMFGRLPGDDKYDPEGTVLIELENIIKSPEYAELPTKADKMTVIRNIHSDYRSAARQLLIEDDAQLRLKVNSVQ